MGRRDPGLEAPQLAGVEAGKGFAQVVGTHRLLDEHPEILGRAHGHQADVATAGTDVRAVGFGRTLGDEDFTEVLRVAHQVRVDAVVPRVVDRETVGGEPDLVGVHPAHGEVGAAQARGVGAGNVNPRGVLELVHGVGGGGHLIHGLLGHGGAALGAFFLDHVAVAQGLLTGNVHRTYVHGIVGQNQWRKTAQARCQKQGIKFIDLHGSIPCLQLSLIGDGFIPRCN